MGILVVAATEFEIASFINTNTAADILITGIGMPATIYGLIKKLSSKDYHFVIQAGVCGAYNPKDFPIGETIVVKKDRFADIAILENNQVKTFDELGFSEKNLSTNEWLVNNNSIFEKLELKNVTAISKNFLTDNSDFENAFLKKFSPDVESMEGAAFHYICLQEKISFLQLRAVSNVVGERDKLKWDLGKAIKNLNENLIEIVKNV